MTDLERFVALYRSFGIECVVSPSEDGGAVVVLSESDGMDNENYHPTSSEKFNGYMGFFSDVEFDADGRFIRQGFWE